MVDTSRWVQHDKYRKFANNWKLVGVSSKIDFKEQRLNEDIVNKILPLIRDTFGNEGMDVIKQTFYLVGLEKGREIIETMEITNETSSCIAPLETVFMLKGFKTKHTTENGDITLRVFGCPYENIIPDTFPKEVLCKYYSKGLVHAVNPNVSISQPCRSCMGDDHCEFVIKS